MQYIYIQASAIPQSDGASSFTPPHKPNVSPIEALPSAPPLPLTPMAGIVLFLSLRLVAIKT